MRGDAIAATSGAGELAGAAETAVLRVLRESAEPLGRTDLVERSGIDPGEWTPVIGSLLNRGLVERQGERRGAKYTVA